MSPGTSAVWQRRGELLLHAAVCGLFSGFAQVAALWLKERLFSAQELFSNLDMLWLAPLADLALFVILGGLYLLATWRWQGDRVARIGRGLLVFLAFLSPLLVFPQLHRVAAVLLAAGLAVQVSRWLERGWGVRLVRSGLPALLLLTLAMGLLVRGRLVLAERLGTHTLPPAPPGAPNVLLLILDTVRASELSLYGYPRLTTPEIQRWAASGTRFDLALSTAPWTLPSHASMFTGRWPHELSADWLVPLDRAYPTLAEEMTGQGYMTAGFVGNLIYCGRRFGLDRGFIHYEDFPLRLDLALTSSALVRAWAASRVGRWAMGPSDLSVRKSAEQINRDFLRWLDRQPRSRPFFAFLNFFDAHEPYNPPPAFAKRFGPVGKIRFASRGQHSGERPWTPAEVERPRNAYDALIAYTDAQIGHLIAELGRRNLLENMVIILTADHGEEFAEHGYLFHGNTLYRASVHVPLIISFPGKVPAGAVVARAVSLRDLATTVIDLAGLSIGRPFPGHSLARFWPQDSTPPTQDVDTLLSEVRRAPRVPLWYPVSKGDMQSLVLDGFRYLRNGDGSEELYDFERDSLESSNLAPLRAQQDALKRFRAVLSKQSDNASRVGVGTAARAEAQVP